jgi:hypothetical protein
MSIHFMPVGDLTGDQVRSVLVAATAAPSPPNSQPWRFRCTPTIIELHADPTRNSPAADSHYREMLLACGAALLNLRLGIRTFGVHPAVQLLPDPKQPELLAVVRPQGHSQPTPADRTLADVIPHCHTIRAPFLPQAVPASLLNGLRQAAKTERAWLATLTEAQLPVLRALLHQANDVLQLGPVPAEWTQADLLDGVPDLITGQQPEPQDRWEWVPGDSGAGQAHPCDPGKDRGPEPLLAIIGSLHDLPLARLQTGQAMQRVLLVATTAGLSASFVSQVLEVPDTRRQLRELIGGGLWPQALFRLGYGFPVPPTPRPPIQDTVDIEQAPTSDVRSC